MKHWEIGPTLQSLRKSRGWTQETLAHAVGITRITLGKVERGRLAGVSLGVILSLLDQFGMEITFIQPHSMPTLEDLARRNEGTTYSSTTGSD